MADCSPMTERSNPITKNIDLSSKEDIVPLIALADEEIFTSNYEGILSDRILKISTKIIHRISSLKSAYNDDINIVMSGCGTSGRIAFLTSRTFNEYLTGIGKKPIFKYLLSGTDRALFVSQELAEDNALQGIQDLIQVSDGASHTVYIGITCGFSAPYVAGQLDHCLHNTDRFTPVLIGFNSVFMAGNLPIENWNRTFFQVAGELAEFEKLDKAFILNPIIGPEPITGSSRMKGGSATKILLDCLLTNFLCDDVTVPSFKEQLTSFQQVQKQVYQHASHLANVIESGGRSLNGGGHIYYLSAEDVGIFALIDASECVPTFGCHEDDVRGFISGGYKALRNDLGDLSNDCQISLDHFTEVILPTLTSIDTVIFIVQDNVSWISEALLSSPAEKHLIKFITTTASHSSHQAIHHTLKERLASVQLIALQSDNDLDLTDAALQLRNTLRLSLACKLACNVISTGAFIAGGKVIENYMADLRIRNVKLFHTAVNIVSRFGACDVTEATSCLLRSIYEKDTLTESEKNCSVIQHIIVGGSKEKVVPIAILLAKLRVTVSSAKNLLQQCPVIRTAILKQTL